MTRSVRMEILCGVKLPRESMGSMGATRDKRQPVYLLRRCPTLRPFMSRDGS